MIINFQLRGIFGQIAFCFAHYRNLIFEDKYTIPTIVLTASETIIRSPLGFFYFLTSQLKRIKNWDWYLAHLGRFEIATRLRSGRCADWENWIRCYRSVNASNFMKRSLSKKKIFSSLKGPRQIKTISWPKRSLSKKSSKILRN